MRKTTVAKRDVLVALGCVLFLLANLGAVGNGGRRRAKEAVCTVNLKGWGIIFLAFANDNGGYFRDRGDVVWWVESLRGYWRNRNMLMCPEARKTYDEGAKNPFMAWADWYDDGYAPLKGSYCVNLWIANSHGSGKVNSGVQEYWRTPYVAGAEKVPVFADGQWTNADPVVFDEPSEYEQDMWTPGRDEMQRFCVSRHNGAVNMLFLDRSVRKIGLKHLWGQPWHRTFDVTAPLPVWPPWMQNFKDP